MAESDYISTIYPVALDKTFEKFKLNTSLKIYPKVANLQSNLQARVSTIKGEVSKRINAMIGETREFVRQTLQTLRDNVLGLIKDKFKSPKRIHELKQKTKTSFRTAVNELNDRKSHVLGRLRRIINRFTVVENEAKNFLTKLNARPRVQDRINRELNKFNYEASLLKKNSIYNCEEQVNSVHGAILSKLSLTEEIINLRVLQNY